MSSRRRWTLALAAGYGAILATIVVLADTDRLTAVHAFVHALPLGDKLGHLVLMGGLAFVVELATGGRTVRLPGVRLAGSRVRAGSAVVLALVVLEELSQRWVPSRSFDYGDLAADVVGIAIGGALGARLAAQRAASRETTQRSPSRTQA